MIHVLGSLAAIVATIILLLSINYKCPPDQLLRNSSFKRHIGLVTGFSLKATEYVFSRVFSRMSIVWEYFPFVWVALSILLTFTAFELSGALFVYALFLFASFFTICFAQGAEVVKFHNKYIVVAMLMTPCLAVFLVLRFIEVRDNLSIGNCIGIALAVGPAIVFKLFEPDDD